MLRVKALFVDPLGRVSSRTVKGKPKRIGIFRSYHTMPDKRLVYCAPGWMTHLSIIRSTHRLTDDWRAESTCADEAKTLWTHQILSGAVRQLACHPSWTVRSEDVVELSLFMMVTMRVIASTGKENHG